MTNRILLGNRDHLSLCKQRNGKVSLRQPNSRELPKSFANQDPFSTSLSRLPRNSGQIIIEYVLLLVVAITIAALVTKAMISSDQGNPGFVLSTWSKVIQAIGADSADDAAPPGT